MDEWRGEWTDEWMDEWMGEWMDEWMGEWMGEWMDDIKFSFFTFCRKLKKFRGKSEKLRDVSR